MKLEGLSSQSSCQEEKGELNYFMTFLKIILTHFPQQLMEKGNVGSVPRTWTYYAEEMTAVCGSSESSFHGT